MLLNNVLITPQIVKNLISVRKFTKDNFCSVEFDPFGFSVKDLQTRMVLLRSNSTGDLYSFPSSQPQTTSTALVSISPDLWHKRLAHLNNNSLLSLRSSNFISCNKDSLVSSCEACQLGKHNKLPFHNSVSSTIHPFKLIHSDVWTSHVTSISGIKYYVLFLDDYSHFLWVFLLCRKSDVFSKFLIFFSYVETQFKTKIQALQCDNGGEYTNTNFHNFFASNGIQFRFSCPHTSQQNGKSERMIRTINNSIRSLLFQAHLSHCYWVEAMNVAVPILNIVPSVSINRQIPFTLLFQKQPRYDHLKVFGCLCFPNLNHSNLHKLEPRSTPCLFLRYPSDHKGFRCVDLKTRKIILPRHVYFDETIFPAAIKDSSPASYHFLETADEPSPIFKTILQSSPIPLVTPQVPQTATQTLPSTSTTSRFPAPVTDTRTGHSMQTTKPGITKPKKQFT